MTRYLGFCSDHGYHDTKCQLCQAAQAYAMTQFDRHQKAAREAVQESGLHGEKFNRLVESVASAIRVAEATVELEATRRRKAAEETAVGAARTAIIEEVAEAAEKKIREVMVGNYTHLISSYVFQVTEAIRAVGRPKKPSTLKENHAHA